jgi:regulator of cell morphogenesis and NO signaling
MLPRLEELATEALAAQGHTYPRKLPVLAKTLQVLVDDLATHMAREERTLFPAIRQCDDAGAAVVIRQLEREHDATTDALRTLRELTRGFTVPEGADATIAALWAGLEELEQELHVHMHLENNVLFPRVLDVFGRP